MGDSRQAVALASVTFVCVAAAAAQSPSSPVPANEQSKLFASDGAFADDLGLSVAVSGDTAVVGAPFGDHQSADNRGFAYVFVRSGGGWVQQAKLQASDWAAVGWFGYGVAVDGDTAVVGAPAGQGPGSAYVFTRTGTTWTEMAKVMAWDAESNDFFGSAVAVSGSTVLVGAPGHNYWPWADVGSVYVFVPSGGGWAQQAWLLATPFEGAMSFGSSISMSRDTAVIGAGGYNSPVGPGAGSAFIFVRSGSSWSQQAKLVASDAATYDGFGSSVAISGDVTIVGSPGDDPFGLDAAGSAYIFQRQGSSWYEKPKLNVSEETSGNAFGCSVAMDGDKAVVGARDVDAFWGNPGAAYVFANLAGSWSETSKLVGSDTIARDLFGYSVAISGDTVLVGAPLNETVADQAGASYVFDIATGPWATLGLGLAGSVGIPNLAGAGSLAPGASGSVTLTDAASSTLAMLFVSATSSPAPFKGGVLATVPVTLQFALATDASGQLSIPFVWPAGIPSATAIYLQIAIQDSAGPKGLALSNAIKAVTP